MSKFNPATATVVDEIQWLADNPQFDERPATLREFIGTDYLNIEKRIRPAVLIELEYIMGESVDGERMTAFAKAMVTGGIGIGKTTIASVVLPYLAHWVLCLKDPQDFFDLLPGSRIAFMQMSTSGSQAKEVVFGDIKARIEHSPWFKKYPPNPNFKNQIRFPKEIWILPGDSAETTFEGYNILGGILDEADSHKVTQNKDYAEQGYDTIHARITSRFQERGFILVIGQMKRLNGFAAKKYKEFRKDDKAYAVRMTIWESLGWDRFLNPDGTRDSFWYDSERHEIIPSGIAATIGQSEQLIEIPNVYKQDFLNNPQKALRDLAGMPPATGSPFIALPFKISEAQHRWHERAGDVYPVDAKGRIAKWFRAPNNLKRVCHIDMAFADDGDALGFAMGHVPQVVEIDGELKPYIIFDLLMRIAAPPGREIFLGDIRRLIYDLRDERGFKIVKVTTDGFQSTDTRQQLERRRIETELVSVDRQMLPYEDLREAIYENRVEFPQYMVRYRPDDSDMTEIVYKELSEIMDNGVKVDHPPEGSKDIADAMAGVVYTLMGDRRFRRRQKVMEQPGEHKQPASVFNGYSGLRTGLAPGNPNISAPIPPVGAASMWNPKGRR